MATIQAVKELLADPQDRLPCNIVFVYEGEEECHSEGFASALAENHAWFAGTEVRTVTGVWTQYSGTSRPL